MERAGGGRNAEMTSSTLDDLSRLLGRERDLLSLLVTRLAVDGAGRAALLDHVRLLELTRAVTVRALALEWGVEDACTLRDLIAAAPGEWDTVLARHRQALLSLAEELASGAVIQRSLREFLA
jgi:hypothetical protein